MSEDVFTNVSAAKYLGFKNCRVMDNIEIPFSDIRSPGAKRAAKRWLKADLDAFLASRRVVPGQMNTQATL